MKKRPPFNQKKPGKKTHRRHAPGKDNAFHSVSAMQIIPKQGLDARQSFSNAWRSIWSYLGPLITIVGLWTYWSPSIAITAGAALDPSQLLQTDFLLTNIGHVPVYDVHLRCSLLGQQFYAKLLESSGEILRPVSSLEPNHPVSRGCFTKSLMSGDLSLKVVASYHWPLIGKVSEETAYFSARKGASGFVLVPEERPSLEPPTLLSIGF